MADSPPFLVHFTPQDKVYANELSTLLHLAYEDLAERLKISLRMPVSVYLCPDEDVFNRLTGNLVPHWGEGAADADRGFIILRSPNQTGNYGHFPTLIRHELVHVLIGQFLTRHALPKWFNEGAALSFSNDDSFAGGAAVSKALFSDSIIPLSSIDDILEFHSSKARLAYEESYLFIKFIEDTHGQDGIVELLHRMEESEAPFDSVFQTVFGQDVLDLELAWYDYLEDEYRWRFLLDFETFLWIFILTLFLFVFLGIRLRNRRTLKRWDDEERLSSV
jgi:hypothetical protein